MAWQVEHEMPAKEFDTWIAFYALQSEEEKKAMDRAKAGRDNQRQGQPRRFR